MQSNRVERNSGISVCAFLVLAFALTKEWTRDPGSVLTHVDAKRALLWLVGLLALGTASADIIPGYYAAPGIDENRDYLNQHVDEYIDPFTGKLQLHHTDLVIRGNGGLDIAVRRSYTSIEYTSRERADAALMGPRTPWGMGWTLHFGRVIRGSLNACMRSAADYTTMLDNPVLELADGSRRVLFDARTINSAGPQFLTGDQWKAECATDGSLGLVVTSPGGTRYDMTVRQLDAYAGRNEYTWYVSGITDRNGNTLSFSYSRNPAGYLLLKTISASDGRNVSFAYDDESNLNARLARITSSGRAWTYRYVPAPGLPNKYFMTEVLRPDGSTWGYEYNGNVGSSPGGYSIASMKYPTGGRIRYTYAFEHRLRIT